MLGSCLVLVVPASVIESTRLYGIGGFALGNFLLFEGKVLFADPYRSNSHNEGPPLREGTKEGGHVFGVFDNKFEKPFGVHLRCISSKYSKDNQVNLQREREKRKESLRGDDLFYTSRFCLGKYEGECHLY